MSEDPTEKGWAPPGGPVPERPPAYPAQYAYGPPPVRRPWTDPMPPGAPYHRIARTESHRWWRPWLGSILILFCGLFTAGGIGAVALVVVTLAKGEAPSGLGSGDTILGDETADLAYNLAALAVFLPFALLVPWLVQRRRPGTLSSVLGRLRWRWLLVCAALAIGFCAVSFGLTQAASLLVDDPAETTERFVGWERFLPAALVIVLLVPFQASAEEYVFRGWLLQGVGACTLETRRGPIGRAFSIVFRTPWPGIAIGAALFTAGHGYTGWGMLDIFLFGTVAGWITVRSGGLEASIALHVLNNLMAFLLPAAVGELDITQGAVPWPYVAADVASFLLYALAVLWLVRKLRIQRTVPEPATPTAEAIPATVGR